MSKRYGRREVLKGMSAACAAYLLPGQEGLSAQSLRVAGQEVEIQFGTVGAHTFRLSILPLKDGHVAAIPTDGSLVRTSWGEPVAKLRGAVHAQSVKCGDAAIEITNNPLTFVISTAIGKVQQFKVDEDTCVVSFETGDTPLLALGEGGPQFDRRGSFDAMRSGQGGYELATHGGRVPIPWLIGSAGWAMFIHQPFGTFDFSGPESKFQPKDAGSALPLD
ncbi:MAG: hypothetical protein WBE97_11925, partial [Candidatus Acidiferrales bacterium]